MYGSGTWTLSQKDVNMTDSLEGKIFRPTQAKWDRESRHKKKICELYDDVTCYTVSCVTRLHYAAHTVPPQKGGGGAGLKKEGPRQSVEVNGRMVYGRMP